MNTEKNFKSFNLLPSILEQLDKRGYRTPTPIQDQSISHILEGKDILGIAKTGSGKTAAFALPVLDLFSRRPLELKPNHIRSLILSPTRELASQIESNLKAYGEDLNLSSKVAFGGVGKQPQIDALNLGLDLLVATPGRLLDLIYRGHVKFKQLEIFVLDEADMMLDMGFLGDVKKIISFIPKKKQTLMFSATMPSAIEKLSDRLLVDPVKIEVDPESTVVENVTQKIYCVEKDNKSYLLNSMLEDSDLSSILLFCKTKFGADRIIENLEKIPVSCAAIHSNKAQGAREKSLSAFRNGEVRVLVATDIAARGIDIKNVSHVINYNLPEDPKSYIHRIGRTARAGKAGVAISFCVESEVVLLKSIEKLIKQKIDVDLEQPFHADFSKKSKVSKKDRKAKAQKRKRR